MSPFPGANAIVMAYRRALMINDQHKITERAAHMVTKTLDVAQAVHSTVHTVVKEVTTITTQY